MKQNPKSILENIKLSIDNIEWSSQTKKDKAISLCIIIYNNFIQQGGDFNNFISLSNSYFRKVIGNSNYAYEIVNNLISNSILETNNSYSKKKNISKGYRFSKLIISDHLTLTIFVASIANKGFQRGNFEDDFYSASMLPQDDFYSASMLPQDDFYSASMLPQCCLNINKQLNRLTFIPEVKDVINNFKVKREDIQVDNEIKDEFVSVSFENGIYRYSLDKALLQAKEQNLNLIKFNDKCYMDTIEGFINRKSFDLKRVYNHSIFDIENKIFRVSRNETNNRLDYNLTNTWSELLTYLRFDNEELVELDISNAQFSILSFINKDLDEDFIKHTQEGTLYNFLSNKLNITEKEAKLLMFRVAFDKVKQDQDSIRNIFPKTMEFIDKFKGDNGYKLFSNLLQRTESLIMIDGLLNHLFNKGFEVFPIHDAMRVKKSQVDLIRNEIIIYFNSIDFKCNVRIKSNDMKLVITDEEDIWDNWQPKSKYIEKDEIIDKDYGDGIEIIGIIENIE